MLGGDWNPPSWCACDSCIDSVSIVFSGFPLSFLLLCNFHPSVQPQPPTNPPPSNQPAANQGWASLFVAVFRCLLYVAVFRCPMLGSVCLAGGTNNQATGNQTSANQATGPSLCSLSAEPASAAAMATKEKNKRGKLVDAEISRNCGFLPWPHACSVARKLCPGGNGRVLVGSRVHTVAMKILVNWQRHETRKIHESRHPLIMKDRDPQPEDQPVPPEAEVLSD